MTKRFFTSDPHFDDPRLNLFGRDVLFETSLQVDNHIIKRWNKVVGKDDLVYVLGDAALTRKGLGKFARLNGKKILIKGNYDTPELGKYAVSDELLSCYFDEIHDELIITIKMLDNTKEDVYLNHYPEKGKSSMFNIVGHVHDFWKVQRNMLNVSTDTWHFTPITEEKVAFQINGIRNFYDINVFAGELPVNLSGAK